MAISANYIFLLPLHVFLSRGLGECTQKCRLLFPRPPVQTFVMMVQVRHRHDQRLKVALAYSEKEKEREEMRVQEFREWTNARPHAGIFQQISHDSTRIVELPEHEDRELMTIRNYNDKDIYIFFF